MNRQFFISTLFLLTTLTACGPSQGKNDHVRLTNVPKDAFWAGGVDGGQWYLTSSMDSTKQTIHFKIYNDYGTLTVDRVFKLHCDGKTKINWSGIKHLISAYDGQRVYLITVAANNKYCYFE